MTGANENNRQTQHNTHTQPHTEMDKLLDIGEIFLICQKNVLPRLLDDYF